jgi:hypothetical protein
VERAASEVLGTEATVRLTEETSIPSAPGGSAKEMEAALKDPAVQYFVNAFKAQVLSVEPVKKASRDKDPLNRGPQDGTS